MSTQSKKKTVFEKIAILKTTGELAMGDVNRLKNSANSLMGGVKDMKDPFSLVINLLIVVAGPDVINKSIKTMISSIGKIEGKFKKKIKEEITSTIGGTKNEGTIPPSISNGFKIHINKLDFNGDLFIPEGTDENFLYLNPFQKKLQALVKSPNVKIKINNLISGEYNNVDGNFTIYPKQFNIKYIDFLESLVDDIDFSDTKTIITNTFSDLFNGRNLNTEQLIQNQEIDMILDNIEKETEEDDSYFKFEGTQSQLINEKIVKKFSFYNNIGSEQNELNISNSDLRVLVEKYGNFSPAFFSSVINKLNTNVKQADKQSSSSGFLTKFLNAFKSNISKTFVLSPQILLIYSMVNSNTGNSMSPVNDIKKNKTLIKCLIKTVINELMSNLFKILKKELLQIVAGVTVSYIKESANKYKNILQSLIKR